MNVTVEHHQTNKATYLMSPLDRELIVINFGLILVCLTVFLHGRLSVKSQQCSYKIIRT
jgi:hypothetical protein